MNDSSGDDPSSQNRARRRRLLYRYLMLAVLPIVVGIVLVNSSATGSGAGLAVTGVAGGDWIAHLRSPFAKFLLQLLIVLSCAKAAGALMRHVRQPAVVGEMLAGILLGPSLFGWLLPQAQVWFFPPDSLAGLGLVSQLGVLVFMFAAGAEFDLSSLRGQRSRALLISHAGIALPFLLGLLLATLLYRHYAPAGVGYGSFALFFGIAMSITAFPVLLRILEDRGYTTRPIGRIAIACAALGDATAWAMLGVIVAAVQSSGPLSVALRLTVALAIVGFCASRLRRALAHRQVSDQSESRWMLILVLAIIIGSLVSEAIGLHALFGAFVAGISVSSNPHLCRLVEERIEPFAAVLLLPLFFASTGLRTRIDLLSGQEWMLCLVITLVATFGKLGGTVLAARWSGIERADSWRLGALMNTRGLMELIVLGVGYDLGLIDRSMYAILVLVAIITTVMTGPLLSFIDRLSPAANQPAADSIRQ